MVRFDRLRLDSPAGSLSGSHPGFRKGLDTVAREKGSLIQLVARGLTSMFQPCLDICDCFMRSTGQKGGENSLQSEKQSVESGMYNMYQLTQKLGRTG
jgi:hypothetical protein